MIKAFSITLLCTLLLICISLINGFPLVYFDTSYYLHHAFQPSVEGTLLFRPLTYSLFLFLTRSAFVAIFIQTLWLVALLWETGQRLKVSIPAFFGAVVFSTLFTSLGLYTNFLLPDILVAIQFLAFFNIVTTPPLSDLKDRLDHNKKIFFYMSFLFASVSHYSNLLLGLSLAYAYIILRGKRLQLVFLTFLLPILLLPTIHMLKAEKFEWSNTFHVYLFSRFNALEISFDSMSKYCQQEDRKPICLFYDKGFDLWDISPKSEIHQLGGLKALRHDIRQINYEILKSPELVAKFIGGSLINWGRQFAMMAGPLKPSLERESLRLDIAKFYPDAIKKYDEQALSFIDLKTWSRMIGQLWQTFFLLTVLIFIVLRKQLSPLQKKILVFLFFALLINSLICGVLTEPKARYQSRLAWVFPFLMLAIGIDALRGYWDRRKRS